MEFYEYHFRSVHNNNFGSAFCATDVIIQCSIGRWRSRDGAKGYNTQEGDKKRVIRRL